ncbi:glycoside hydrolase family 78 protein [Leeuwenhoekiella marinoflava]|uniref:glycoside hydrolase family 78 protein n=1 Tax=Leeuwenhoekiella marinoflava TaxID=988 RepID=UPI003003984B
MNLLKNILLAFIFSLGFNSNGQTAATDLICEFKKNPVAVANANPRLGWKIFSEKNDVSQTAYHILVASTPQKLTVEDADFWNSSKINSDQSQLIFYSGKPLKPGSNYYWKVKVWDQDKKGSQWSEVNSFRIAPDEKQLQPVWIGAITKEDSHLPEGRNFHTATYRKEKKEAMIAATDSLARRSIMLRKVFKVSKKITEAVVYISGLGHYELTINGSKIGTSAFAPLWTDYDKSVNYNSYELDSDALNKGENAIGVVLGNGMYNMIAERYSKFFVSFGPPTLFFNMKITYSDGTSEVIKSDSSWKYDKSPISFNSIFGGEDYDANLEQPGWDQPNFNAENWKDAIIQEAPKGKLQAQVTPPVIIQKEFSVKEVNEIEPNTFVFNMGQNLSGFPTIQVKGKKGQKIRLWVGEGLNEDGRIRQGRSGKPYYFDYTLKGNGIEEWQPRFSYYGYQYIEIEQINYKEAVDAKLPTLLNITSNFIYNDSGESGFFESSNPIFNKAHELINNAIKSNFQAVLTDCPHREKLGWLEEAHLNGPGLIFNYNMQKYIPGIMQNIKDAQRENGLIPNIAPEYVIFGGDFTDSPEWGVTGIVLPWMYYEYYGDSSLLEKYYPVMKKYVDYLTSKSENHILSYGLGDWYDYGDHAAGYSKNSPIALSATSHYYFGADLLAKAAKLLNKEEDSQTYEKLSNTIKKAFNTEFFNSETKQYGTSSQFSNAVPVFMDIVEPEYKAEVMQNLVDDIKARGYRLTTGDVGNRYLFQALARNGENETMYKMNNHYDTPGYGFQIKFGLTTLTEQWDPRKGNSWNHFMMGQIEEWFYRSLAGIVPDPEYPGFKHFFIQPELVGDLNFVKASYNSIYGTIISEWEKSEKTTTFKLEIPANTSARVKLPIDSTNKILINGKPYKRQSRMESNSKSFNFKLASGKYIITTSN